MNLMWQALSVVNYTHKNKKVNQKLLELKEYLQEHPIVVDEKYTKIGNIFYYNNVLPYISRNRDVLKKPDGICKIRVNWKKKKFEGLTTQEIYNELKPQYAWNVTIVDAEHTRNKYKNKSAAWVVFDTESEAKKNMEIFNRLFITAIEWDCIEEYRKFKANPDKRPLTFDQLVPNYADLYEMIDRGEI